MNQEHIFAYTGADLEKPLMALLKRQQAKLAALEAKIAALPGAMVEDAQKPVDLRNPSKSDGPARLLLNERTTLLVGIRETELWVHEARRQPHSNWWLTMADLGLLYSDVNVLGLTG